MADVTPSKSNIDQTSVQYGASVSEATMTQIAGSINFINDKQFKCFHFEFMGPFFGLNGGEAGAIVFPNNVEVVGVTGHMRLYGTTGNTVVDIHKIVGSTDSGTVLSTKITLPNSMSNGQVFGVNYVESTSQAGGATLPVFSSRNFNTFDALRVDIDSNAVAANDLSLFVWYRPR